MDHEVDVQPLSMTDSLNQLHKLMSVMVQHMETADRRWKEFEPKFAVVYAVYERLVEDMAYRSQGVAQMQDDSYRLLTDTSSLALMETRQVGRAATEGGERSPRRTCGFFCCQ
jgi:hypothetical protein